MALPASKYPLTLSPLKVGPLTLKNRIQFAPHALNMVTAQGEPTNDFVRSIEKQARTGVGLITIYATPVDRDTAIDYASTIDLTNDNCCCNLVRVTEAAHIHDAKISIELVHAGRGADPALNKKPYALAPSNVPIPGQQENIKVMDEDDMQQVINSYVDCALRAKRCNFDMIMMHAAHGNLIAQFLSPLTNKRTDEYGGSLENRFRFPLRLLKAVREAIGNDIAIEMRISGDERVEGGMGIEEVIEFIKLAQEYIDIAHISSGLVVDWRASFYTMPPYYNPRGLNIPLAKQIKDCEEIKIPVSVVGGLDSLEMIEDIIASGSADVGVVCRQLMADPDMIHKTLKGKPEDVTPCLRCFGCAETFGSWSRCAVNPSLDMLPPYDKIYKADEPKTVLVVGGGTAGMQAARTLVARGHKVTLAEASDQLGGVLPSICNFSFKGDLKKYYEWAVRTTMNCGAEILLNTKVDAKFVEDMNPDVLFIAVGSTPAKPPIPGLDNAYGVLAVDRGEVEPQGKVVVCGGGVSGCECALDLAMRGCDVTVLDMIPTDSFASGLAGITRNMLMMLIGDNNVKMVGEQRVTEISGNGVKTVGADGSESFFEADYVVDAFGMVPRRDVIEELDGLIIDTYKVGDANVIGNIKGANFKAYTMACLI
ncbi:MAG: NAD(P)/FAD-dependent oxidoreductase [bacterium]|nr:NAD(P)/FAD-dependent oxidoreductase [bacterium]